MMAILLLSGCDRSGTRHPPANQEQPAASLARRLANEQAQALFRCQPFLADHPPLWTNRHWLWRDRRGYGGLDFETAVSLAPDLSTQSVQVFLLDSRPLGGGL